MKELLRLLAEDASGSELARVAGDDAVARELALRIRAVIDASKKREAELTALVEVARELASASDPSGVLDTIVHRARTLIGADVAYLTLYDEARGDTYMRATDGSLSAAFQQLRVPTGAGLGGLVASTRRPYWTTDYPSDQRFRHTGPIDHAVGDEGLIAICGTPLLVDDAFVGVLFASNRTARPFSREEVLLLGSLAALAAVTIVQVRAAAETAEALDQLSAAHAGAEHAAAAHDRFADLVLSGGDVDAVAAALAELLGVWVVLVDAVGNELAVAGRVPGTTVPWQLSSSGRLTRADGCWVVAATAKGERLGALVIGGVDDLSGADQRIVERAAVVTALVLLFRRQAAEQSQRAQADLLTDILSGNGDVRALTERLRLLAPIRDNFVVAVCRGDHSAVRARLPAPLAEKLVLSGPYGGDLVLLLGKTEPVAAARDLSVVAKGVTIAVVGPAALGEVAAAHRRAARLATTMVRLGRSNEAATSDDLGVAGLIGAPEVDVQAHVRHVLGAVLEYDAQRGTDLVGTLRAYFAAGQSPTRAAAELHIHPNTVQQRLDRVGALLGADWQSPERSLNLQVALQLHQTIRG
ncbi:helix-turn-helix domain-containing protein [Kribbella sp. NPDC020789]